MWPGKDVFSCTVVFVVAAAVAGIDGAQYMGCYKDPFIDKRLLADWRNDFVGQLSNAICQAECRQKNFRYAGTQFGKECYCSNTKPSYVWRAPEAQCGVSCEGNPEEKCGGQFRLSVYDTRDDGSMDIPGLYKGCYVDASDRLLGLHRVDNPQINSPDFCAGVCYYSGFKYAGMQYGGECFCGNELKTSAAAKKSECDVDCPGDPRTKCGGSWRLSVYATGIVTPDVSKTVYMGCYMEPGVNNRLMTGARQDFHENLTNKVCRHYCGARGFRYMGTQWREECYCSNTRPQHASMAKEESCSLPCKGDENDKCGGDLRLSVYDIQGLGKNPVAPYYVGCYRDGDERTLSLYTEKNRKMTPDICVGICRSQGYSMAGVEYGEECFCDNRVDAKKKVSDIECSTPCLGDGSIKCGGQWKLSVYRTGAVNNPSYVGCYLDEEKSRTLDAATFVNDALTTDFCIGYCLKRGFLYAGAEFGRECFCGDKLSESKKVNELECDSPCDGDGSQKCGGARRLSVYKASSPAIFNKMPSDCSPSATIVNGKAACTGEIVFQEDFNSLDLRKWTHDLYIPDQPDYQFVIYEDDPKNIYTRNGMLYIKPTQLDDTFVISGRKEVQHCTGQQFGVECVKQAAYHSILPPVQSAKINTKDYFSFLYGKVEIRAKLPVGDWIVPEVYLEPRRYSTYGPSYGSGRMRLALARGNKELLAGQVEIGNRLLETGVVMGQGDDISALSARWTSTDPQGWHKDFHLYTLYWTPDDIAFSVDNTDPVSLLGSGSVKLRNALKFRNSSTPTSWSSGSRIAPFDREFYISLGLSVGGHRDFPDSSQNGRRHEPKPWSNTGLKALVNFFQARHDWSSTWQDETSGLQVDYVKVTAL